MCCGVVLLAGPFLLKMVSDKAVFSVPFILCLFGWAAFAVTQLWHWLLYWEFFVGALAYADDLALLAPSASAMRTLLKFCDDYAKNF